VTAVEKVRLNFGHRILNQDGKLILEAETFHVCTGVDEKPKRLPEELVEKLKPYLNASPEAAAGFKSVKRIQEWILFYLVEREKNEQITTGKDLFFAEDVEPLIELGLIRLEQSHAIPSLQNSVMATTIIHLTDSGKYYFER
jgi:hypothetical protein